ncbi:hypothetical protein [Streptomyces sp. NPDC056165]|uniref:hypothetical protein n=1 Tax=Streptomyces sp. NPDC056165 TaxID=3345733 RepID=UPI0035DA8781
MLVLYRRGSRDDDGGAMLRAFVQAMARAGYGGAADGDEGGVAAEASAGVGNQVTLDAMRHRGRPTGRRVPRRGGKPRGPTDATGAPLRYTPHDIRRLYYSDRGRALSMYGTAKVTAARRLPVKLITATPVLVEA